MYRKIQNDDVPAEEFKLPFEGQLSAENRWVIMSKLIPWSEYESEYAEHFSPEMGAPAKSFRMALGALIIQEKLGISDRETVEQIRENPYLQYFIGLKNYHDEPPFNASMMVHFRQRIGEKLIGKINLRMVQKAGLFGNESTEKKLEVGVEEIKEPPNRGKLLIDATVAPADIKYPTDVDLLNTVRKDTEKIVRFDARTTAGSRREETQDRSETSPKGVSKIRKKQEKIKTRTNQGGEETTSCM